SNHHALSQIYEMDLSGLESQTAESMSAAGRTSDGLIPCQMPVKMLTDGTHDYTAVYPVSDELLLGVRMSMSAPSEIFAIDLQNPDINANQTQISRINTEFLSQIKMGRVEARWIPTTDGQKMLTWVIFPPDFDASKTYPTLLYCQGGPQSTVSQFWSYRWNFQIMAANDYIIVAPNRRGLPGFGQEWLEQISGDYGGQNMKDYLAAIDAVSKEPYVDKDKLGCVGASYGGFSVYWLAGHHNKRFKAFIAHDGMFNLPQQSLETEELWFTNWDLGGAYWDKDNATAQRSFATSPHLFIDQWDTPILIIHGEKDYRIVASQGMAAFNAALMRGIPAELLIYPDENHWVLRPQNGILWQRRFFRFLDRHVKGLPEKDLQTLHHAEETFAIDGGGLTVKAAKPSGKEQNTETQVAQ
ncbi:MAG: S9 family peptidase, partial [Bacteroidales bacterium]|nr:S9 family peptidase [Bacteroidales bacterium]